MVPQPTSFITRADARKDGFSSFMSGYPAVYGVYQTGEVYARSVTVIGTLSAILIPKRFWSYAVQRGEGIWITRT